MLPLRPVVVSWVPNSAPIALYVGPPLMATSWVAPGPVQRYICMRGREPSVGVAKWALSVPLPSCASALTGSLPAPPLPKLLIWKLPAASLKPWRYRRSWMTLFR